MAPVSCSYYGCSHTSSDKQMFKFPVNNKNRIDQWLENTGQLTKSNLVKAEVRNRYICSDHFDRRLLLKRIGAKRIFLSKNAIPKHYQHSAAVVVVEPEPEPSVSPAPPSNDSVEALEKAHNIIDYCQNKETYIKEKHQDSKMRETDVAILNQDADKQALEVDKCKRRTIRTVARLMKEKKSEEEVWAELDKEYGCDTKILWKRMRLITIKKLNRLLVCNDRVESMPAAAKMTLTDWLLFDLVLVQEDVDVIGRESIDNHMKPLTELFSLVQRFNVEALSGEGLAEAWTAATVYYNAAGHQCSPMLLQRRWYQLKKYTREQFYKFWEMYRGNIRNLPKAEGYTPNALQKAIARRFPTIITQPFPEWHALIDLKLIILPNEFEAKMRMKNLPKPCNENSPDIIMVVPHVETIDLGEDSGDDVQEDSNDATPQSDTTFDTNLLIKSEPDIEIVAEVTAEKITSIQAMNHEIENAIKDIHSISADVDDDIETLDCSDEEALPQITSVFGNVKDSTETLSLINDISKTVEARANDSNIRIKIENFEEHVMSNKNAILEGVSNNANSIINDNEVAEDNDVDIIEINDIRKAVEAGSNDSNIRIKVENYEKHVMSNKNAILEGVSNNVNLIVNTNEVDANEVADDNDVDFNEHEIVEPDTGVSIDILNEVNNKLLLLANKMAVDRMAENICSVDTQANICSIDVDADNVCSKEDSIKKEADFVNAVENIPDDLVFDDDGIQFIDDGIEFEDDDSKNIKDEDTGDGANESEGNHFDLKLIMDSVVYTTRLENMAALTDTDYSVTITEKTTIEKILAESKPVSKKSSDVSKSIIDMVSDKEPETVNARISNVDVEPEKVNVAKSVSDMITDKELEQVNVTKSASDMISDAKPEKVKATSTLFQKPRKRTFHPIQLCKNPDFNTRLKRINIGFFSYPRNIALLKECKPLTIDLCKSFETSLSDGTIYLHSDSQEPAPPPVSHAEVYNASSVLPSAMSVQSLIDNTVVSSNDYSVPNIKKYRPAPRSVQIRQAEKQWGFREQDTHARRIGPGMLTMEISPIQIPSKDCSPKVPVTTVLRSPLLNPHQTIAPQAIGAVVDPYQVESIKKAEPAAASQANQTVAPTKKKIHKRPAAVQNAWYTGCKPTRKLCEDSLLAADTLEKIFMMWGQPHAYRLKNKPKKPRIAVLPPNPRNKDDGKEKSEVEAAAAVPQTRDKPKDVVKPICNTMAAKCCWAREKIISLKSNRRIRRHRCGRLPRSCKCCCRFELAASVSEGMQTACESIESVVQQVYDGPDAARIQQMAMLKTFATQTEPMELIDLDKNDDPDNALIEIDKCNDGVITDKTVIPTTTTILNEIQLPNTDVSETQMSAQENASETVSLTIDVDDDNTKVRDIEEKPADNLSPHFIISVKVPKASTPAASEPVVTSKIARTVPKHASRMAKNKNDILYVPAKPLVNSYANLPKLSPISRTSKVLLLKRNQALKSSTNDPISVGPGKILLTDVKCPPELKNKSIGIQTHKNSPITFPKGVSLVLLPGGQLTYVLADGVTLSEDDTVFMNGVLNIVQSQINPSVGALKQKTKCCWARLKILKLTGEILEKLPEHGCPGYCSCCCRDELIGMSYQKKGMRKVLSKHMITEEIIDLSHDDEAVTNMTKECDNSGASLNIKIQENTCAVNVVVPSQTDNVEIATDENAVVSATDTNLEQADIQNKNSTATTDTTPIERQKNNENTKFLEQEANATEVRNGTQENSDAVKPIPISEPENKNIEVQNEDPKLSDTAPNNDTEPSQPTEKMHEGELNEANKTSLLQNRKSLLSDLMEISGISAEDTLPPEPAAIPQVPTLPELTPITSFSELKYASENSGTFFKLDFETGVIVPINVCIKGNNSLLKTIQPSQPDQIIDLTDDSLSALEKLQQQRNIPNVERTKITRVPILNNKRSRGRPPIAYKIPIPRLPVPEIEASRKKRGRPRKQQIDSKISDESKCVDSDSDDEPLAKIASRIHSNPTGTRDRPDSQNEDSLMNVEALDDTIFTENSQEATDTNDSVEPMNLGQELNTGENGPEVPDKLPVNPAPDNIYDDHDLRISKAGPNDAANSFANQESDASSDENCILGF